MVACWRASRSVGRAIEEAANSTAVAKMDLKSIVLVCWMRKVGRCGVYGGRCVWENESVVGARSEWRVVVKMNVSCAESKLVFDFLPVDS